MVHTNYSQFIKMINLKANTCFSSSVHEANCQLWGFYLTSSTFVCLSWCHFTRKAQRHCKDSENFACITRCSRLHSDADFHLKDLEQSSVLSARYVVPNFRTLIYEGWNFNFGNTPLDWIQELLEWRANEAGRMGPSPTYIHNGSGPSRNGHTQ